MTSIAMPQPFDPIAEVKAILASIDTMLGGVVPQASPVETAKPKPQARKSKSDTRMLGDYCKVSWRKTSGGMFREPVHTNPHACDPYGTKIDSLATYIAKLAAIGCVAVGTDEATGATVYRTPEGTELKVRAQGTEGKTLWSTSAGPIAQRIMAKAEALKKLTDELGDCPVTTPKEYKAGLRSSIVEATKALDAVKAEMTAYLAKGGSK